jgi:hypothetical protein
MIGIPYVGSFQQGHFFRSADPITLAWRKIEQFGTSDSLSRIATRLGGDPSNAHVGSLRIRQALELRNSARQASALTRPLLLYYCALNLLRGILGVTKGGMGDPFHGATYVSDPSLLDCKAKIKTSGTLLEVQKKLFGQDLAGKEISLLQCLAQMPELLSDFPLLLRGSNDIAVVKINAIMQGAMSLRFMISDCTAQQFKDHWTEYFHWFKDLCRLDDTNEFTLIVNQNFADENEISVFCQKHLLTDLFIRHDPLWFDHVQRERLIMTGRIMPYVAMLFILSNVARYEPEKLDDVMRQPTDLAYVLNTAINNVDLHFPQVVLSRVSGKNVYFI